MMRMNATQPGGTGRQQLVAGSRTAAGAGLEPAAARLAALSHSASSTTRCGPNKASASPSQQQQQQRRGTATQAVPAASSSSQPSTQHYYRESAPWPTASEISLTPHDLSAHPAVDLVVAGAGPSGVVVAERVAAAGFSVCVIDQDPFAHWPNNYGVWVDEFSAMGLEDCVEVIWSKAKVWLNSDTLGERCARLQPMMCV